MKTPRRLQMHACDVCRCRKIRCDSVDEQPCSACNKSGVDCKFTVAWRRPRRPRPTHSGDSPPQISQTSPRPPALSSSRSSSSSWSSSHTTPCFCHPQTYCHPSNDASDAAHTAAAASVPPESEVALSINIAENGLLRFFRDGLSSTTWHVFDAPENMRVAYVGTHVSNMTHLIKLDQPRPQSLVYPYPQIRPPLSLSDADVGADGHHPGRDGASTSYSYIARDMMRDIHSFPEKEIRDDFIDAYFDKVNPYFPVIDEYEFRAQYGDPSPHKQPALVLLHSVLLVGAHVSSHPKAVQARHIVKAVLFRRAKCVFDMRHEHDRLHLVQAALLFTWHLQNGDTASCNSGYWLGVACRIAFGIGMHRDLLKDPLVPGRMPIRERRLWRRVWWTLFQAEVLSALEHGRPSAIRSEDFDQEPLCDEDFLEVTGRANAKLQTAYCIKQTELCQIALDIVTLSAPGMASLPSSALERRTDDLNMKLVQWMLSLAPTDTSRAAAFGDIYLRLHYHTIVIHLYRLIVDRHEDLADAAYAAHCRVMSSASVDIVACFESLHEKNMLAHCPFTAVTALTAAAIQIAKDVQHSLGSAPNSMLAVNALCLLDRVCAAAEHLSIFWPNVEGVRKVFRSLSERFTTALRSIQHGEPLMRGDGESLFYEHSVNGVDWTDILGMAWHVGPFPDTGQALDASLFGTE